MESSMTTIDDKIDDEKRLNPNVKKCGIIDDDPGQIRLFKEILNHGSSFDLRYRHFTSPDPAIRTIKKKNHFDVLLVDKNLNNELDGVEVVQALREAGIECPIIIFSVNADDLKRIIPMKNVRVREKPKDLIGLEAHAFCKDVDHLIEMHDTHTQFSEVKYEIKQVKNAMVTRDYLSRKLDSLSKTVIEEVKACFTAGECETPTQVHAFDVDIPIPNLLDLPEEIPEETDTSKLPITPENMGKVLKEQFSDNWMAQILYHVTLKILWVMGGMIIIMVAMVDLKWGGIIKGIIEILSK